ncbi:MAG: rod shape-determining protein MreD [Gemmatimonadales bacterium]
MIAADRSSSRAGLAFTVAALAFLHFTLRPVLDSWYVGPNLLVCGALIAARGLRPNAAIAVGFALGLLEDSIAVSYFGLATLLLLLLTYMGSRTRDLFLGEERLFIGTYLVVGTWLYETASYLLMGGGGNVWSYVFVQAPLDGLATGVLGYMTIPLAKTR